MQVSVETTEGLERKMTVIVPDNDTETEVTKRLKEIAKEIRIDGFRPGKVPLRIVKQRFAGQVRQEVIGDLIQKTFYDAIAQEKISLVGTAKNISINESDKDVISYTAIFDVMPEAELADLSDVTIEKVNAEVTDSDVDEMINKLREQKKTWSPTEEAAQNKDRVTIDFKGYVDGQAFEGGEAKDASIILGSNQMIDGFEDALIGVEKDEELEISVTFPEDYQSKDLAGKPATFNIEVKNVETSTLPEIDEQFIKEFGIKSGDKDEFMADIRNNMEFELKQKLKSTLKDNVTKMLLEKHSLDIPQLVITAEAEALKEQMIKNMESEGRASNFELPASIFEPQAKDRITLGLLMAKIAETAEIKLDSDRVTTMIEEYAKSYEDPQALIDYYSNNPEARQPVENVVLEEQIIEHILSLVKTEDKTVDFNELMDEKRPNYK